MSISNLFYKNNYSLICNDLSANSVATEIMEVTNFTADSLTVGTLNLENKQNILVNLYYNNGINNIILESGITLSYWTIDKIIFLEFPKITVSSMPSGLTDLFLSEQIISSPSIAWGFNFKYDAWYSCFYQDASNPKVNATYYFDNASNTVIGINKQDGSSFSSGLLNIYPTVITLIKS